MSEICYLCGDPIVDVDDASDDHVPPKQFYARAIRRAENLSDMVTLPAHKRCNEAFSLDEEYVTVSLATVAEASPTALAILDALGDKWRAGRSVPLGFRLMSQLNERPSGLYLPSGLTQLHVEADRLDRVLWKIVRGLYYIEHQDVLPEDMPHHLEIFEPTVQENPKHPEFWEAVKEQPAQGPHPAIFEYKHLRGVSGPAEIHLWGMLLWDSVMVFVAHPPVGADPPDAEEE